MRLIIGLLNLIVGRITKVPRMEAEPGKTKITLTLRGLPVATVVLQQITVNSHDGATVEFVDLSQYMEARRVR